MAIRKNPPGTGRFEFFVPDDLREELIRIAHDKDVNVADLVRECVRIGLPVVSRPRRIIPSLLGDRN